MDGIGPIEPDPAPPMPPVWAEGGLWSDVCNLARWVASRLGAYQDRERTGGVLAAATLREMHRPRYLADDEWTQAWSISWCGQRAADTVWITHSGWVLGFTSSICFEPRSQTGAIVLLNGEQSGSTAALAISLAETTCAAGLRKCREQATQPRSRPAPASRCWVCTPGPALPMWSGWNAGTGGSPSPVPSRMAGGLRCHPPAIRTSSPSTPTPRKLATR
jgi:Beta-lactamase